MRRVYRFRLARFADRHIVERVKRLTLLDHDSRGRKARLEIHKPSGNQVHASFLHAGRARLHAQRVRNEFANLVCAGDARSLIHERCQTAASPPWLLRNT